jgi:hypothetical protein
MAAQSFRDRSGAQFRDSQWSRPGESGVLVHEDFTLPSGGVSFQTNSNYRNFDSPSNDSRTPRSPNSSFLPAINNNTTPRYYRGPEVRSPPSGTERPSFGERLGLPEGENYALESEHYTLDLSPMSFGGLHHNHGTPVANSLEGFQSAGRRPPLNRSASTSSIVIDSALPNAVSNLIGSTNSPPFYLGQFNTSFENSRVENPLEIIESPPSSSKPFPFKKSKTAPKLGVISPTGLSPIESPVVKGLSRKNSVNLSPLPDRPGESNFLASEVAEAVLDAPSNASTPLIRNKFLLSLHQDSFPPRRSSSNVTQSVQQPVEKSFFIDTTFVGYSVTRPPLDWNLNDSVRESRVNNQSEDDNLAGSNLEPTASDLSFDTPAFLNASVDELF